MLTNGRRQWVAALLHAIVPAGATFFALWWIQPEHRESWAALATALAVLIRGWGATVRRLDRKQRNADLPVSVERLHYEARRIEKEHRRLADAMHAMSSSVTAFIMEVELLAEDAAKERRDHLRRNP